MSKPNHDPYAPLTQHEADVWSVAIVSGAIAIVLIGAFVGMAHCGSQNTLRMGQCIEARCNWNDAANQCTCSPVEKAGEVKP